MAAAPPPYSPRDARRQARAMAQAQRAQYGYLRRRPSFVSPVLLIAAGVIALLLETDRLDPERFWPWYARWWPALLILVGLGLLGEYILDRNNPQMGRRSIGGTIWLIVLLSIVGASNNTVLHGRSWSEELWHDMGDHGDWLSMMGGEQHTEDHTLVRPIAPTATLTIENARGDVQVAVATVGSPSEVRVEAHQVVHSNAGQAARHEFEITRPVLIAHGSDVTIASAGSEGASVDLKVTVPAGVALVVRTSHGDVTLSGVRRDVLVNDAHGDVTVDDLGGGVRIQMDHGNVIAHGIAGDLAIDGRADDVSIERVKGRTLLDGDFFGDTKLESVSSLVHFHSSRTDLEIPRLGGEMTLDSGGLRLVNPSGGIHVMTRSKDIEITDLVGNAQVENNNGDMDVSTAMPLGNLQLTDRTGSIKLTVPSNASFSIHGVTGESGDLSTDFSLQNQSNSDQKSVSGQVGQGGPHLELIADHGDLTLRRGSARSAQSVEHPETPERANAPEGRALEDRPDHPVRHLHARGDLPPETSVQ